MVRFAWKRGEQILIFKEQQKWHRFVPKICKNLGFLKHTSKADSFLLISSQSRLPIDPPSKQKTPSHNLERIFNDLEVKKHIFYPDSLLIDRAKRVGG